jgi:hypothetical protein
MRKKERKKREKEEGRNRKTWRRTATSALNQDCIKHLLVSVSSFKTFLAC